MNTAILYITLPFIGLFGGLCVSLAGIGSTLITLPALLFILPFYIPSNLSVKVAIATTLACATIAAISGAIGYLKKRKVIFSLFYKMSACYMMTSIIGVDIVHYLPSHIVETILGTVLFIVGTTLALNRPHTKKEAIQPIKPTSFFIVIIIAGLANSICGIATGTLAIPFLKRYYTFDEAIGTSIASTCVACFLGTTAYMIYGIHINELQQPSIGYVYVPAFITISTGTIVGAKIGFYLKNYINPIFIKYLLTALIYVAGLLTLYKGII